MAETSDIISVPRSSRAVARVRRTGTGSTYDDPVSLPSDDESTQDQAYSRPDVYVIALTAGTDQDSVPAHNDRGFLLPPFPSSVVRILPSQHIRARVDDVVEFFILVDNDQILPSSSSPPPAPNLSECNILLVDADNPPDVHPIVEGLHTAMIPVRGMARRGGRKAGKRGDRVPSPGRNQLYATPEQTAVDGRPHTRYKFKWQIAAMGLEGADAQRRAHAEGLHVLERTVMVLFRITVHDGEGRERPIDAKLHLTVVAEVKEPASSSRLASSGKSVRRRRGGGAHG